MSNLTQSISPQQLKSALSDGHEIALLDVREHGQYGEGHPFFSVNCPFSSLEYQAPLLVPCRATRVVVFDDEDEGVARRAAESLRALGYGNLSVLDGGAQGWKAAGFELFKGVNVPSKAFGEMVEHDMGTPSVSAKELNEMIRRGENIVILDGRSPGEYTRMNIPTARSCPNAELGYRIDGLAPDPDTKVIINCAGRTRSIIGAQTLISLGIANRVAALRNGTQGWQLSDLTLDYSNSPDPHPPLGARDLAKVRARAAAFARANGVPFVSPETLENWRADEGRSTYLFDVRTEQEYRAGHLPGACHAAGGQLVQATDHWVATRHARIVLCCDLGPRAVTSCYWLRAMGHDAFVLDLDVAALAEPETGPAPAWAPALTSRLPRLTPEDFATARTAETVLVDASSGESYRKSHIAGALWAIRPRLQGLQAYLGRPIVVCGDESRASLLAADLLAAGHRDVRLLEGGVPAWKAAGLSIESSPDLPPDEEMIDFLIYVHDRQSGSLESARKYLEWETGLIAQMDDQERAVFSTGPFVSKAMEHSE
ncbi:MAG: rhodanese-like domain-containing protein [Kiloniellaceae bacterium]